MKNNIIVFVMIFIIMFVLPFATVMIAKSDAGMTICLLLFFVINPIFSAILGFYCGFHFKTRWFIPIVSSMTYLISCWLLFDLNEFAFVIYSIVYLLISLAASLLTFVFKRFKSKL